MLEEINKNKKIDGERNKERNCKERNCEERNGGAGANINLVKQASENLEYKAKILSMLDYGLEMFYDFKEGGREKIIMECKMLVSDEYFKLYIPMLLDIYLSMQSDKRPFLKFMLVQASPKHQEEIVNNILSMLKKCNEERNPEKIALLIGIIFESYAQGNMATSTVRKFIDNVNCLISKTDEYEYPIQILELLIDLTSRK
ncbi:MAG: hypothetical protein QXI89_00195 [Candidatus Anstonellales archaeon]